MFEQRLQQRLRLVLVPPAILVGFIALLTLVFATADGVQPRETVFDLFLRTAAPERDVAADVAVIDIGPESVEELGPWPWPRTALASLVRAAGDAGANAVVITIPSEGSDPLSPDALMRFWPENDATNAAASVLTSLPTNDATLANAALTVPTAVGVGVPAGTHFGWGRADIGQSDWIATELVASNSFIALPGAPIFASIDPGFRDAGRIAVVTLPRDRDGVVRRVPVLWTFRDEPLPSAAVAPFILETPSLRTALDEGRLQSGGPPPSALLFPNERRLPLGRTADLRLWLPDSLELPTVPAWRVLEGGETWTGPLSEKTVFIGASIAPGDIVSVARGELSSAAVHAHLFGQIAAGDVTARPGWVRIVETLLVLLGGMIAIGAAIYTRPLTATLVSVGLAVSVAVAFYFIFARTNVLLDPVPVVVASLGGPLLIFSLVVGNILLRDDAVRGAFHGALPDDTMNRLQSAAGARLLRGVRRDVVVLSCGLRMPAEFRKTFDDRPDDFIRFTAEANDLLRNTILAHHGTVDYGENGRLLGYWNVPESIDHPVEKACACALRMIDDINALTENVETSALAVGAIEDGLDAGFADTSVEIGLASAPCFAGPVGLRNRNRYSAIGDAVRISSALRRRASLYGPTIITDDVVYDTLRHHYAFLDLDVLAFGESEVKRTVYGLVGNPFLKASKGFRRLADIQRELVHSWREGNVAKATVELQKLRGTSGAADRYVELFEERLAEARSRTSDREDVQKLIEHIAL